MENPEKAQIENKETAAQEEECCCCYCQRSTHPRRSYVKTTGGRRWSYQTRSKKEACNK
jgi:hypothetical protein